MKKSLNFERLTNLLTLVSLVQAAIYLGFIVHFLEVFLRDVADLEQRHRIFLNHVTANVHTLFVTLLFFAGLIHLAWLISSIYALIGNKNGNERSVSQYVAITVLICLMDTIFPFIVLPTTFTVFQSAIKSQSINNEKLEEPMLMEEADYGTYFWLIMTFIRGGCFTYAIDVFSAVVAYRRFMELHELNVKVQGNAGMAGRGIAMDPLDDDLNRPTSEALTDEEAQETLKETTYVPPDDQQPIQGTIQETTTERED